MTAMNNVFNRLTDYHLILAKKEEIVKKEAELVNAKKEFLKFKRSNESYERDLSDARKDFEIQKEQNNIEMMSKLYAKQLTLKQSLADAKKIELMKWALFESTQFDYLNLTRQLMQEENIYIYKVRRLGLLYNAIFLSIHLFIFVIVQMNELRKRNLIMQEVKEIKIAIEDIGDNRALEPTPLIIDTNSEETKKTIPLMEAHFWQGIAVGSLLASFLCSIK